MPVENRQAGQHDDREGRTDLAAAADVKVKNSRDVDLGRDDLVPQERQVGLDLRLYKRIQSHTTGVNLSRSVCRHWGVHDRPLYQAVLRGRDVLLEELERLLVRVLDHDVGLNKRQCVSHT